MENPQITISVPYFGTSHLIRDAILGILNQTHQDYIIFIINDGMSPACWSPISDLTDRRIVRYDLPQNRGPYFAHAISLAACNSPFWMPHDSDDFSHADRIERLVGAIGESHAVSGICRVIEMDGKSQDTKDQSWQALYRTDYLKRIGGTNPNIRVSYDSMILEITQTFGKMNHIDDAVYEYRIRPGSLLQADETGRRSAMRYMVWLRIRELMNRFKSTKGLTLDDVGQTLHSECPQNVWDDVNYHATCLRNLVSR
jgi:glycosyltransferase involved in cell wall biosynthesis